MMGFQLPTSTRFRIPHFWTMNSIPWGRELELWVDEISLRSKEGPGSSKLPSARYCQSISIQAFFFQYYCFLKRPWHHHFHVQKIQYNFASAWHSRAIVLYHCIFPLEGTNQWVTIVRYIYIYTKHRKSRKFHLHFTSMDRYVLRFWMKTWLDDSERVILRWDDWPWNTSLLGREVSRFLCLAQQVGNGWDSVCLLVGRWYVHYWAGPHRGELDVSVREISGLMFVMLHDGSDRGVRHGSARVPTVL